MKMRVLYVAYSLLIVAALAAAAAAPYIKG